MGYVARRLQRGGLALTTLATPPAAVDSKSPARVAYKTVNAFALITGAMEGPLPDGPKPVTPLMSA